MAIRVIRDYLDGVHNYYGLQQPAPVLNAPGVNLGNINIAPVIPVNLARPSGGPAILVQANAAEARELAQDERDDNRAHAAAVVGAIATVAAAGAFAYTLRNWSNDREALQEAKEFKRDILPNVQPDDLNIQMCALLNSHIEITESRCAVKRNIVLITAGILATAAAGFAGGMFAIQALITAAIVSAVILVAISAFLIVWHCTDPKRADLPQPTRALLDNLRAQLQNQAG